MDNFSRLMYSVLSYQIVFTESIQPPGASEAAVQSSIGQMSTSGAHHEARVSDKPRKSYTLRELLTTDERERPAELSCEPTSAFSLTYSYPSVDPVRPSSVVVNSDVKTESRG